jgi:hypothetical protein
MAPRLRYTDAAPGPPFSAKVTGRLAPGTVYAVNMMLAMVLPFSSRTGKEPTVASYFSSWPSKDID